MPARRKPTRPSRAGALELPRDLLIHVAAEQAGETVATVLRQRLPQASWEQVRRLSTQRRVTVNGNLCLDPARRLKPREVVKALRQPAPRPPSAGDIEILHLDADLVVFVKPAGMTTMRHPEERRWPARRKQLQPTLDELLPTAIAHFTGGRPPRVRLVHRLDRDTSGVMVAALSPRAEQGLIAQFKRHSTQRKYLAIVRGDLPAQTIRNRLARDRGDGRRGSIDDPHEGQEAVTHVRPLERHAAFSVVECVLETGRTHQIRIHLSEAGHAVLGDKEYGPTGRRGGDDPLSSPRQALHAAELGFEHPTSGQPFHFSAPLPADLQQLLTRLRKT